ncbi:Queuine tRNA-ribosyltransferase [Aureliella helgolandensis]|uniref:Queuine tRNA-ribosyltransferase n=1 Tax=Aureliella helgolandensis TaxID=2527968 RepID=A0A518G5S8_9BACT|nr:tRNA guanosine(34) transglycosylase Tgt [Aureliella helgolandensis]QDV23947.1 Queuine tRNA-ribosyltransferase [Aureliella helgolandensis]
MNPLKRFRFTGTLYFLQQFSIRKAQGEFALAEDFGFNLQGSDPHSSARFGELHTPRGTVETPVFMPVGTLGTVKGLTVDQVKTTGASLILGNTYHLALRPGSERVERLGGLHEFMGWDGPILTDSGGFQIFSLSQCAKITEQGATFQSHIDGRKLELTPEESIRIQERLGSDIAMVLDHVVALPAEREVVRDAMQRSTRWASRCLEVASRQQQAKFAIVQGGLDVELRQESAQGLTQLPFDGYAVGGLSVGEPPPEMYRMIAATTPFLPADKPRYLMGVGRPIDLLEGIARGIDMFDCVMPTRNGRNALAFTWQGTLRMRNAKHADDRRPIDETCPCLACRHSRAYLRHLFIAGEMLGPILLTHHNLTFYQQLMSAARKHIAAGSFGEWLPTQRGVIDSISQS